MIWVTMGLLTYLLVLAQCTLVSVLTLNIPSIGPVCPDLPAILIVFLALHVRRRVDAMLSAWIVGFILDLTTGAGPEISTVVGPMAIGYCLSAGAIFSFREMVFCENVITQCVMAAVFCIIAHFLWVTLQWSIALRDMSWSAYLVMLVQAVLLALYTAVLMPLGYFALKHCRKWLITAPTDRSRRWR